MWVDIGQGIYDLDEFRCAERDGQKIILYAKDGRTYSREFTSVDEAKLKYNAIRDATDITESVERLLAVSKTGHT